MGLLTAVKPPALRERYDSLYWTGTFYNWNSRCAACHSTNLKKNYSSQNDHYKTTWFEINVGCEACHGPGSDHLEWALKASNKASESTKKFDKYKGFNKDLSRKYEWRRSNSQRTAKATPIRSEAIVPLSDQSNTTQLETCAACHSRRNDINNAEFLSDSTAGFFNHYELQAIESPVYSADGQMQEEAYVYGSFLQSKMYQEGVTCSNCHNPHSLELVKQGNEVCTQCHDQKIYDQKTHYHHPANSAGAQCVNCHMTQTTFMSVDSRRDHSFRIPRPDLSAQIGTENACNLCHTDRSTQWSATAIENWLNRESNKEKSIPHYGEVIAPAQRGLPEALPLLLELAQNSTNTEFVRASVTALLKNYPGQKANDLIQIQLKDPSPMVRAAAVQALEFLPLQHRWFVLSDMLDDPVKLVRLETARLLSAIPASSLSETQREKLNNGIEEYIQAQLVNADFPSAQLNLGTLYLNIGDLIKSEQSYRQALLLDPYNVIAIVSLSDIYRLNGQIERSRAVLLEAKNNLPDHPLIEFSIGLTYVMENNYSKSLVHFESAAYLAPEVARYAYSYALALNQTGEPEQALLQLNKIHRRFPDNRDILFALATLNRDQGHYQTALYYAKKLTEQYPQDTILKSLQQQLKALLNL